MMKRAAYLGIGLVLLGLNWAALHDILKGEPSVVLEWAMVVASVTVVILLLVRTAVRSRRLPPSPHEEGAGQARH